jgi:tRNA(Arg) A34 adenosine deaminase TadA
MNHEHLLRAALAVAKRSFDKGNLPFGCLLADASGHILEEGENTVVTDGDAIGHCEINLVHQLAGKYEPEFLKTCTVYASTEPCPMCTGAIYWSGIGKIVYALGKDQYHRISGTTNPDYRFDMAARELLLSGGRKVEVVGPTLGEEAEAFYRSLGKSA